MKRHSSLSFAFMKHSRKLWRTLFFFLLLAALCGSFAFPVTNVSVHAAPQMQGTLSVVINEIAWAGTQASATGEWIELYNPGSTDINLAGWTLKAIDGTPSINLSGTILANSFYLLERNDTTISDITADQTYSGALSNTGETLELRDNGNVLIDTANQAGGAWPAGDTATNPHSMERINVAADTPSAWATNNGLVRNGLDASSNPINGTPKQINSVTSALTATVTSTITDTPAPTLTATNTSTPTSTRTPTATVPSPTSPPARTVIINEVAWSGTTYSAGDEWFELYNNTGGPINLAGWHLTAEDGSPDIALSGTITTADRYFVVARYALVFNDLTPDLTYSSGSFDNGGEILYLLDPAGTRIDTANFDGGAWNAGLGSPTYASMERIGTSVDSPSSWATYGGTVPIAHDRNGNAIKGTPGQANWITTVTPTPSSTPTNTRTPTRTRTPTPYRTPTRTRTPTRPPTIAPPQLVAINEFVPRPGHDWNNDGVVNVGDEFIELLNHGTVDVNLSGWSLDDEVNIGSDPYRIPAVILKPGERIVFYGSETGLLLSDGGDGVRLLKPNGQLIDAYNYSVARYPDESYCRLPDNGGLDDWNQNCYPTPGLPNSLNGSFEEPTNGVTNVQPCPISDTLPEDFVFAECDPFGNNIWRRAFWDATGWYDEKILPKIQSRWDVFAN